MAREVRVKPFLSHPEKTGVPGRLFPVFRGYEGSTDEQGENSSALPSAAKHNTRLIQAIVVDLAQPG